MRDQLVDVIREFTGTLLNPFDLPDVLHRLTEHSIEVLDASGCGIMLEDDHGELAFAAASNDDVIAIERHQERAHEGACFEAYTRNEVVAIADATSLRERWPAYAARLDEAGLRAVIGVPMNAFAQTIGVINIYRSGGGAWTPEEIEAAEIVASVGAGYIVYGTDMRAQHDLAQQLQAAISSRDLIGQAKGILMEREGMSAEAAFTALRQFSQHSNRKLHEVAMEIVGQTARNSGS